MTKQREHIAAALLADRYPGELLYIAVHGENESHLCFGTDTDCIDVKIYSHNDNGDAEYFVTKESYQQETP